MKNMNVLRRLLKGIIRTHSRDERHVEFASALYTYAKQEAMRLNHEHVGFEHLFLAIAKVCSPAWLRGMREQVPVGPDVISMGLSPLASVCAVMADGLMRANVEGRDQVEVQDVWEAIRACGGPSAALWSQKLGFDLTQERPTAAMRAD